MEERMVAENDATCTTSKRTPDVCDCRAVTDASGDDDGTQVCKPTSTTPQKKRFHGKNRPRTEHVGKDKKHPLSQGSLANMPPVYILREPPPPTEAGQNETDLIHRINAQELINPF